MYEFRLVSGLDFSIWVRIVRIFKPFRDRTIGQLGLYIRQLGSYVILVLILQKNL